MLNIIFIHITELFMYLKKSLRALTSWCSFLNKLKVERGFKAYSGTTLFSGFVPCSLFSCKMIFQRIKSCYQISPEVNLEILKTSFIAFPLDNL